MTAVSDDHGALGEARRATTPSEAALAPTPSDPGNARPGDGEHAHLLAPGAVVSGRYRIVRFVAQGGMGEVYEAEDLELSVRLALKTLRLEAARNPIALERLRREVLFARSVSHPNV